MKQKLKRSIDEGFKLTGEVKWLCHDAKTGKLKKESPWMKNQVVANDENGLYLILDRLAGTNDYTLNVSHGELGDDDTAASENDTDLGNGLERVALGNASRSAKTATFRFFFPDGATADDTYEEFGMFIDGSATLGSGQLFNRIVLSQDIVKASGEDYTVVCRLTGTV